jgi:hypothetical protein
MRCFPKARTFRERADHPLSTPPDEIDRPRPLAAISDSIQQIIARLNGFPRRLTPVPWRRSGATTFWHRRLATSTCA